MLGWGVILLTAALIAVVPPAAAAQPGHAHRLQAVDTVVIIVCPVDDAESMKLTNRLKAMKSPL